MEEQKRLTKHKPVSVAGIILNSKFQIQSSGRICTVFHTDK